MNLNKIYKRAAAAGLIAAFGAVTAMGQLPNAGSDNSLVDDAERTAEFLVQYKVQLAADMIVEKGAAAQSASAFWAQPIPITTIPAGGAQGNLARISVTSSYPYWDVLLETKNGGRLGTEYTTGTAYGGDLVRKIKYLQTSGSDVEIPLLVGVMNGSWKTGDALVTPLATVLVPTTDKKNSGTVNPTNITLPVTPTPVPISFAKQLQSGIGTTGLHGTTGTVINTTGFGPTAEGFAATFFVNTGFNLTTTTAVDTYLAGNAGGNYTEEFTFSLVASY